MIKEADPAYGAASGDHLFILAWNDPGYAGRHLIKQFMMKNKFDCSFYLCNEDDKVFYRVEVNYKDKTDYLKLQ